MVGKVMADKKHPGGRPSKYQPRYADELLNYFNCSAIERDDRGGIVAGHFPTLARFAANIGVCRDTLQEWAKVHAKFSAAYKKAKDLQEANLIEGTLAGAYQPSFAIFTAKNVLGWRDKTETELSGPNGGPQQHEHKVDVKLSAEDAYLVAIGKK